MRRLTWILFGVFLALAVPVIADQLDGEFGLVESGGGAAYTAGTGITIAGTTIAVTPSTYVRVAGDTMSGNLAVDLPGANASTITYHDGTTWLTTNSKSMVAAPNGTGSLLTDRISGNTTYLKIGGACTAASVTTSASTCFGGQVTMSADFYPQGTMQFTTNYGAGQYILISSAAGGFQFLGGGGYDTNFYMNGKSVRYAYNAARLGTGQYGFVRHTGNTTSTTGDFLIGTGAGDIYLDGASDYVRRDAKTCASLSTEHSAATAGRMAQVSNAGIANCCYAECVDNGVAWVINNGLGTACCP